jgi:hypothetical protein
LTPAAVYADTKGADVDESGLLASKGVLLPDYARACMDQVANTKQ